jgi:histidine triad (HIT) family protein
VSCIFCQIVAGESESFVVASSSAAVAFLDINPLATGHTLVVPTRHVTDLLDGGAAVLAEVAPVVEETARLLVGRLGADGLNVFQSSGAAAGQEVFHLHLHLVPRWKGDGMLGGLAAALRGEPLPAEELDAVHQRLLG